MYAAGLVEQGLWSRALMRAGGLLDAGGPPPSGESTQQVFFGGGRHRLCLCHQTLHGTSLLSGQSLHHSHQPSTHHVLKRTTSGIFSRPDPCPRTLAPIPPTLPYPPPQAYLAAEEDYKRKLLKAIGPRTKGTLSVARAVAMLKNRQGSEMGTLLGAMITMPTEHCEEGPGEWGVGGGGRYSMGERMEGRRGSPSSHMPAEWW